MTFIELVESSNKKGFITENKPYSHILKYERKDGILVEIIFPMDKLNDILKERVNIDWEYKLTDKKTGLVVFKDWLDINGGTAKEKIERTKDQVWGFVNNISTKEVRVKENSVFSIFGFKFLKFKTLQFKTEEESKWCD